MSTPENWPGSIIQKIALLGAIGKFLRTHKAGGKILTDWLESVPPDRTEDEYRQLKETAAKKHEAGIEAAITDYNARRVASGLPPVDRHLKVIAGAP